MTTVAFTSNINHPAPERGGVSLGALSFALVGAPAAWALQMVINYALTSHACYPREVPLAAPIWSPLWPVLLGINLIAIVIGLAAGFMALRNWRKIQREQEGSHHHLLEVGEGRTRFLAMCGLLTSTLFLVALVFTTISLLLVPACGL